MTQKYQIEIVELEPQAVLVIERESPPQDLGRHLAEILPKVHRYITGRGQQPAGAPFMQYLDMTDRFRIAAGIPVAEPVEGEGEIELRELPGGKAITALFTGLPHMVGEAWTAVFEHARRLGLVEDGDEWVGRGSWDVYVNDPGEVGPENSQTRLYLPIP